MNFRRWIVFAVLMQVLVVAIDKGGGLILYMLCTGHPDESGFAGLVSQAPFVLMAVANLGLSSAQVYFLRRGRFGVQDSFSTNLTVALVWGGFVGLFAGLAIVWLLPWIDPRWDFPLSIVLPLCILVPMLLVASFGNTVQLVTNQVKGYAAVHLVTSLLFLPAFLGFFFGLGGEVEKGHASYAMAWGRLVATALVVVVVLRLVSRQVRIRCGFDAVYLREALRYGWRANLASTLTYLTHRFDSYLIGLLFVAGNPATARQELGAQVGFYSMAVTWAELVWQFPDALRDLFFSKVAGSTADQARAFTPVLARMALFASVVGGVAVLLLLDPVMGFVTHLVRGSSDAWSLGWSPTVRAALFWLTPGTVAYTINKVLQADLAGRNRQDICVRGQWLAFGSMVALDVVLVPRFGAVGAAAASSAAYVLASIYTLSVYCRETRTHVTKCLVLHRSDFRYFREIAAAVLEKLFRRRR